jgi:hypothetical protein
MAQKKLKENQFFSVFNKKSTKSVSFNDRINDNLCQIIISYLSFEEKIRFESVSKLWQKFIFNKQFCLQIDSNCFDERNSLNKLLKTGSKNWFNLKAFESVLKKSKFINNIIIRESFENEETICQLITKYCLNLNSITLRINNISEETLRLFGLKLGNNLSEIVFEGEKCHQQRNNTNHKIKAFIKLCPNLMSIKNLKINDFVDKNEILVHKLIQFKGPLDGFHNGFNDLFINSYKNSLKNIELFVRFETTTREQSLLLKQLSQLKQLESLDLFFCKIDYSKEFVDSFKQMAIQCKQIKRFVVNFGNTDSELIIELFDSFRYLKQLKFFDISSKDNCNHETIVMKGLIDCEKLKDCKQLTHLKMNYSHINDHFFDDIDSYLPQLTHLKVNNIGSDENSFSHQMMSSLAKLRNLKVIDFESNNFYSISDSEIINIVENNPQIKSIRFNKRLEITNKTIDALIGRALKNPRINYSHNVGKSGFGLKVNVMNFYESLPNNLILECNGFNENDIEENYKSDESESSQGDSDEDSDEEKFTISESFYPKYSF